MLAMMGWLTGAAPRAKAFRQTIAAIGLSIVTLLLFNTEARFVTVAPSLVSNLDLANGLAGWSGLGAEVLPSDDGSRELRLAKGASGGAPIAVRMIAQPGRFSHIRVAAEMRTAGIEPGPERWQRAGLVAPSFGPRGERLTQWPYEIAMFGSDAPWTQVSRVLPVGGGVASIRLFAYVGGPAGVLTLRHVTIDGMAETAWAAPVRYGLILAWGILGLSVLGSLLARWRPIARPLSAALGIAILFFALYPQPHFQRLVRPINAALFGAVAFLPSRDDVAAAISSAWGDGGAESDRRPAPAPRGQDAKAPDADANGVPAKQAQPTEAAPAHNRMERQVPPAGLRLEAAQRHAPRLFPDWLGPEDRGHMAAFAALAFVVTFGFPQAGGWVVIGALLVLGASTEALQTFSPTRDAELSDLVSDLVGILGGLGLGTLLRAAIRKISYKSIT